MARADYKRSPEERTRVSRRSYLQEGTVLQNRYRIDSLLSVAGPGQVYQAVDLRFPGNRWALKAYKRLPSVEFFEEMKAEASFHHPHLAKVVDFFEEGDFSCVVMEFVHGRSLEQILDETVGPLPERQVLSWGVQCADALLYLHRHQMAFSHYRNLSPRKILISTIGELKLVPKIPMILESTSIPGVMGYAPPESFDEKKDPDERSDVYTLAAIMHRCLIGGNPTAIPFVFIPIDPVNPHLDSAIERILDKATQAQPGKRYTGLGEFRREIYRCLQAVLKLQPFRSVHRPEISEEFWWLLAAVSGAALSVWTYILWVTDRLRF